MKSLFDTKVYMYILKHVLKTNNTYFRSPRVRTLPAGRSTKKINCAGKSIPRDWPWHRMEAVPISLFPGPPLLSHTTQIWSLSLLAPYEPLRGCRQTDIDPNFHIHTPRWTPPPWVISRAARGLCFSFRMNENEAVYIRPAPPGGGLLKDGSFLTACISISSPFERDTCIMKCCWKINSKKLFWMSIWCSDLQHTVFFKTNFTCVILPY